MFAALIDELLPTYSIDPPIPFMEDFASVLAQRGMTEEAARLFGSADAARAQAHWPLNSVQAGEIAGAMAIAKADLSPAGWEAAFEAGRQTPIGDALRRVQRHSD